MFPFRLIVATGDDVAQIELGLQVTLKAAPGSQIFRCNGDGCIEAGYGRAEHDGHRRRPCDA